MSWVRGSGAVLAGRADVGAAGTIPCWRPTSKPHSPNSKVREDGGRAETGVKLFLNRQDAGVTVRDSKESLRTTMMIIKNGT